MLFVIISIVEVRLTAHFQRNFLVKLHFKIIDIPLKVIELYFANGGVFYDLRAIVISRYASRKLKTIVKGELVSINVKIFKVIRLNRVVFELNKIAELKNAIGY